MYLIAVRYKINGQIYSSSVNESFPTIHEAQDWAQNLLQTQRSQYIAIASSFPIKGTMQVEAAVFLVTSLNARISISELDRYSDTLNFD